MLYKIGEGNVRLQKALDLGGAVLPISVLPNSPTDTGPAKVLDWVDSEHFAYWTGKTSRSTCDINLNCEEDKQEKKLMALPPARICGSHYPLGLIYTQRAVCFVDSGQAYLTDSNGGQLRLLEQNLPWDARFVSSVQGQRFGLEWQSNTLSPSGKTTAFVRVDKLAIYSLD
jgi:hypothetical protein